MLREALSKTVRVRAKTRTRLLLRVRPREDVTVIIWNSLKYVLSLVLWGRGHGTRELARRLGVTEHELCTFEPTYREFTIAKRGGGTRRILAPDEPLKQLQRLILRRLLRRLRVHSAVCGFERGQSIVTNALPHAGKPVVLRMDIKDFFSSTRARRVYRYFRKIGWNRPASKLLLRLCTHNEGLPQGAPTSPRLSNLVNYRLDAQLEGLKIRWRNPRTGGLLPESPVAFAYTRYADDLTFSFAADDRNAVHAVILQTKLILARGGYRLHLRKKLQIRRQHDRQLVTGLVVNVQVNLPRRIRRWLRSVEHHVAVDRPISLTPPQLAGWRALQKMVAGQAERQN